MTLAAKKLSKLLKKIRGSSMSEPMDNAAQEVLDLIQALEHYNRNEEFPPDQFKRFREMVINAVDWSFDMLGIGNGDEGICQRILSLVNEIENRYGMKYIIGDPLLTFVVKYNLAAIYQQEWAVADATLCLEQALQVLKEYMGIEQFDVNGSFRQCIFQAGESSSKKTKRLEILLYLVKGYLQCGAIKSQSMDHKNALQSANSAKFFLKVFIFNLRELNSEYVTKFQNLERDIKLETQGYDDEYFNPVQNIPEFQKFQAFSNSSFQNDFSIFCQEVLNNDPTERDNFNNAGSEPSEIFRRNASQDQLRQSNSKRGFIFWKHNSENNDKYFKHELQTRSRDLGVTSKMSTMWLREFKIGNVMHITALAYRNLLKRQEFETFFNTNQVVTLILTYSSCLFSIATENRFICQRKLDEEEQREKTLNNNRAFESGMREDVKQGLRHYKLEHDQNFIESEKFHFTAIELLCAFVEECPLMNHLIGSFQRNYNPNLQTIPEANESLLSISRNSSFGDLQEQSRRQSLAANLLQSMAEYDYINEKTDLEEKKQLVKHMVDTEMSNKKELKTSELKYQEPFDAINLEMSHIEMLQSFELDKQKLEKFGEINPKSFVLENNMEADAHKIQGRIQSQFSSQGGRTKEPSKLSDSIEVVSDDAVPHHRKNYHLRTSSESNRAILEISRPDSDSTSNPKVNETIPQNLLTAQQLQQESINERFSKKSNRSQVSYVSGDLSDIRNSLNRRQNVRGSLLEDQELREIFSRDNSDFAKSRIEPSQEDNVILHKGSLEYEKYEFKQMISQPLNQERPAATFYPRQEHRFEFSQKDSQKSPIHLISQEDKSEHKISTQICTNSPGSNPHFSGSFKNARELIINTTPQTQENGNSEKAWQKRAGQKDSLDGGNLTSPETVETQLTPEGNKSSSEEVPFSRHKMINSDFQNVASTLRKVSQNLRMKSRNLREGSMSRLSSDKSNVSHSRNLSNLLPLDSNRNKLGWESNMSHRSNNSNQFNFSSQTNPGNLVPNKNVFTSHYRDQNNAANLQQIVKNTVNKLKKDTEVGRLNFKRKNYYEQLKTQSINTITQITNPSRILNSNSFGRAAQGTTRGQLTTNRVMDLIKKNFEMSVSKSRSRRNNSLNQYVNLSRNSDKSTSMSSANKRKSGKKQEVYSGLPSGFTRDLFSRSYRDTNKQSLIKEKSRSLSKKIGTNTREALAHRINSQSQDHQINKKLLSKRKISHQTNLQGSLQDDKLSHQHNRTYISELNFMQKKKSSGLNGSHTERTRTKSFVREELDNSQPNFRRDQFRELITKMYDEDVGSLLEAKNKNKFTLPNQYLASHQKEDTEQVQPQSLKKKKVTSAQKTNKNISALWSKATGFHSQLKSQSQSKTPRLLLGGYVLGGQDSKSKSNRSQSKTNTNTKQKSKRKVGSSSKKELRVPQVQVLKPPKKMPFSNIGIGSGIQGQEFQPSYDYAYLHDFVGHSSNEKNHGARSTRHQKKSPEKRYSEFEEGDFINYEAARRISRQRKDQQAQAKAEEEFGSPRQKNYRPHSGRPQQNIPDTWQISKYLQSQRKAQFYQHEGQKIEDLVYQDWPRQGATKSSNSFFPAGTTLIS